MLNFVKGIRNAFCSVQFNILLQLYLSLFCTCGALLQVSLCRFNVCCFNLVKFVTNGFGLCDIMNSLTVFLGCSLVFTALTFSKECGYIVVGVLMCAFVM
jgi:hypothetical protein